MLDNLFGVASINTYVLLILYSVYAIISTYLFSISTSGFTWLLMISIESFLMVIIWLIAFVGTTVKRAKNIFTTQISKGLSYLLFLSQVVILFFNSGDCGDSSCPTNLDTNSIRHFLTPNIIFKSHQINYIPDYVLLAGWIVYFICLFKIITKAFPLTEKAKE